MPRCRKRHVQIELVYSRRGGRRKGAGRKPIGPRRRVAHTARPVLSARHPVHVTLRVLDEVGRLRRRDAFRVFRRCMLHVAARQDFRIVHLSIQGNHVHLICEADNQRALARGIQAFKISCARQLNKALGRRGAVFADRYHAEVLATPRQVRNALCYVLNNWRKHREDRGTCHVVDPFSTGIQFPGWREPLAAPSRLEDDLLPAARPRTWLLAEGWRRAGPISRFEIPSQGRGGITRSTTTGR